jgi:hypothetical protein
MHTALGAGTIVRRIPLVCRHIAFCFYFFSQIPREMIFVEDMEFSGIKGVTPGSRPRHFGTVWFSQTEHNMLYEGKARPRDRGEW